MTLEPTRPSAPSARARSERIYRTLRDRICLLDYPPGARLSEEELAAEFEISRTPLRKVLARLEAEGLIGSVHGVGTIVTDVDVEELAQVYALRRELAPLIGRLDPLPFTPAQLDRIRAMIAECDAIAEPATPAPSSRSTWPSCRRSTRSPATCRSARSASGSTSRSPASC